MRGLDRGLQLIAAENSPGAGGAEQRLGLRDQVGVPQRGVLLGKGDVVALRIAPYAT